MSKGKEKQKFVCEREERNFFFFENTKTQKQIRKMFLFFLNIRKEKQKKIMIEKPSMMMMMCSFE
jgi:hypothetical protein